MTEEESRYAVELSPPTRGGRRRDWASVVAACRAEPRVWYLAFKHAPESTTATVRGRQVPALQVDDGRWEVGMRNMRRRRGEVWIRFIPYTDDELRRMQEEVK